MRHRILSLFTIIFVIGLPVLVVIFFSGHIILSFLFFYPLTMSVLWMIGGLTFYFQKEIYWKWGETSQERDVPQLPENPLVSILIPCFNEGFNGKETIFAALNQNYKNIEVIAINDGSSDNTASLLNKITKIHPRLRVIHLAENQGKAMALRMGALAANSDYLVCIDGDAVLDPDAVPFLIRHLIDNPRVGAITGNPRIRTRSTLIGKVQVGEFSSIIGLIKRTQRVYGQVFTVSGVISAFRRQALARVGYWSLDMVTEDIDISWKLQRDHWSIFYEPRALCWILMPETLRGLWKQRLRWARGGTEALIKNYSTLLHWKNRRMWVLLLEYSLSSLWAFSFLLSILLFLIGLIIPLPQNIRVDNLIPPAFTGLAIALCCVLQFTVSILIESRYEKNFARALLWVIWFPMAFWMINLFTTIVSFPQVTLKTKKIRARWTSPDRGINQLEASHEKRTHPD